MVCIIGSFIRAIDMYIYIYISYSCYRSVDVTPEEFHLDLPVRLYRIVRRDLPLQVPSFHRISGAMRGSLLLTLAVPWPALYHRPDAPEMKTNSVIDTLDYKTMIKSDFQLLEWRQRCLFEAEEQSL